MLRPSLYMCLSVLSVLAVCSVSQAQWRAKPVDEPAANRGDKIYTQSCSKCHGVNGRGSSTTPDLLRSDAVLHDRMNNLNGETVEAALKNLPDHHFELSAGQWSDLSQSLGRMVYRILRSGYSNQPTDMLNGDAKAGEAYFTGAGGCNKCHSATGDLAHVATANSPAALQQRFLFPNSIIRGLATGGPKVKPAQVSIKLSSGQSISGDLVRIDDFNVTVRDDKGIARTWRRSAGVHVEVSDPYSAHIALLDKYTDADIHNLTAYLETLK